MHIFTYISHVYVHVDSTYIQTPEKIAPVKMNREIFLSPFFDAILTYIHIHMHLNVLASTRRKDNLRDSSKKKVSTSIDVQDNEENNDLVEIR
jgi:hypothetical protein